MYYEQGINVCNETYYNGKLVGQFCEQNRAVNQEWMMPSLKDYEVLE